MEANQSKQTSSAWNAVYAMAAGVAGLIIAEFIPAGVLTPMATELGITEGTAGQAVTATSIFAVVTSLVIAYVTRKLDRRKVLLALSFLLACSSLLVAFAPGLLILLIGRVLLGISLGGFWSMATAVTIRLVREDQVPKALSIIFGASSLASVFAAPLGSYLSGLTGWRSAFLFASAIGFVALIWQWFALPRLRPTGNTSLRTTLDVLKTPHFRPAMLAILFVFCGRFASFTYLRPFLEQTAHLSVNSISIVFLIFGLAYFVGNAFAPGMIRRDIRRALMTPPFALAAVSAALLLVGYSAIATGALIFLWGAFFGPVAPAWSTWVAKRVPEHAETGGGLYVASVQLSAAIGAFAGGLIFDATGSAGVIAMSGISWLLAAVLVVWRISGRSH